MTRALFAGMRSGTSWARSSEGATGATPANGIRVLGFVVVAVLLLAGCSSKEATDADVAPTVTVQVGAAEKEPIERKVIVDATLYPLDQAALVPKVTGPIKSIYVQRGSKVHAGQLLAELEDKDLAGAVIDSRGGFLQAQATYESQMEKVGKDVQLAKEQLDQQQKLYESRVALFKQGAVAAKDVEDAKVALTQAQNQYDLAQRQLDVKIAEAQLTSAKGKTASAEAQLSYARIVSPIEGVVTDRPYYPGETPAAGAPVVTVMNLSQVVARAHIAQQDAAQLKAGDPATVSIPGQPPDAKGKVSLVSPALDPNSTTVEVWVQAPNPQGKFKPGTGVRLTIVAQRVPDAIVIPAAALLTAPDGVTSVITLDTDNKPHKQHVKTGIRSGDDVQITQGLAGGERVVTVGAFELDKEDDPVLAKTKIQVQAPKMPDTEEEDEDK